MISQSTNEPRLLKQPEKRPDSPADGQQADQQEAQLLGVERGTAGSKAAAAKPFPHVGKLPPVDAFGIVVIVVGILAGLAAVASYIGSGNVYRSIGKGAFALDTEDRPRGPKPGSPAARAEQEEEVRQMIQARSDRGVARGEEPLDVEAEVSALLRPAGGVDEELREEVRQLVIARNERRARRGEGPLDVEAEVDRQLRDLGA